MCVWWFLLVQGGGRYQCSRRLPVRETNNAACGPNPQGSRLKIQEMPPNVADHDLYAVGPALRILQINVEGLSPATRSIIAFIVTCCYNNNNDTPSQELQEHSATTLTSHSTHNRSFWRRVFPANHLAMVLTKQTYNNQDKHKKPKDIQKKPQKLNLTKPN